VIARLWDGDAHLIPGEYHALACQLLGCETLPEPGEPAEMYLGSAAARGRLASSSRRGARLGGGLSRSGLSLGEWATISIHAVDKRQAGVAFGYCEA